MKKIVLLITLIIPLLSSTTSFGETFYTEYTKDVIQGNKVITALNVNSLGRGRVYEFYFQTVQNNRGHYWYVPVTVIRGRKKGPKFLITSGVHGNELNGLAVAILLKEAIDPKQLTGTITIVHGLNAPGLLSNTYDYKPSGAYRGQTFDTNGSFDSDPESRHSSLAYAGLIWTKLLKPNADYAIDLHDSGLGTDASFLIFTNADYPKAITMAKLIGPDIVYLKKHDASELAGVLEHDFVTSGVPAITVEIGSKEEYEAEVAQRAFEGILNYLKYLSMIRGEVKNYPEVFIANSRYGVGPVKNEYYLPIVGVNDLVEQNDVVAIAYNSFGEIVWEYRSPVAGKIYSITNNQSIDPYYSLVEIYFYNPELEKQVEASE